MGEYITVLMLGILMGVMGTMGLLLMTGHTPRAFDAYKRESIEKGYAKECVGDIVVWIDESCEVKP